jgi:hypothetical protein
VLGLLMKEGKMVREERKNIVQWSDKTPNQRLQPTVLALGLIYGFGAPDPRSSTARTRGSTSRSR